jgi:hypothetical protein
MPKHDHFPSPEEVFNAKPPFDPNNPAHVFAKTMTQNLVSFAEELDKATDKAIKVITDPSQLKPITQETLDAVDEMGGLGPCDVIEPPKPKRKRKQDLAAPKPPVSAAPPPVYEITKETGVTEITEDFIPLEDFVPLTNEITTAMELINKMTQLITEKRLSQAELIEIVKASGLNEVIDICQHEELVPLINSNLEIVLRTKA